MKSYVALIACLIFCFWALRKMESADDPDPDSTDLWIPAIWLFRCASRSIDYWLSGSAVGVVTMSNDASPSNSFSWTDPLLMLVLMALGARILHRRNLSWPVFVQNNRWLVVLFVYMGISCIWAPASFVSAKRYIRTVGDLIMAIVTMTGGRPFHALFTVIRRTAVFYAPLSILLCKYFPKYGRTQSKSWSVPDSWVGLSTHKNSLTAMLMMVVVFFVWHMLDSRKKGIQLPKMPGLRWVSIEMVYVIMCVYLMMNYNCRSGTAITATAVGFLMIYLIGKSRGDGTRLAMSLGAVAFAYLLMQGVSFLTTGKSFTDTILALMGKNPTLTGRTEFWPILIQMGLNQPLLGAGYGGFWTAGLMDYFLGISRWGFIPESHNGYIETFVNLGFIGLGLILLIVKRSISYGVDLLKYAPESGCIRLTFMAMILVHNFAEASFPRENHTLWVLFLMLAIVPLTQELPEREVSIHEAEVLEATIDETEPYPVN